MKHTGTLDWFQTRSPWAPEMSLRIEEGRLHYDFRCKKAAHCDETLNRGDFVEGLWEKDVAELFLAGPGSRYQEINLSPVGAWWSAVFSDYREREKVTRFPCRVEAFHNDKGWRVGFSAELEDIEVWRGFPLSELRASATAILYGPEPVFFAWNHGGGGEPDFHRGDLLKPVV